MVWHSLNHESLPYLCLSWVGYHVYVSPTLIYTDLATVQYEQLRGHAAVYRSLVSSADDMEAIPVKQFIKHVSELYSNNQHGFSEDFEVSGKMLLLQT